MFKNSYQSGLLSIFYSCGSNPLLIWDTHVENGHIKRLTDKEVNSIVLEIVSTNVSTTYISCPKKGTLGIKLPFLVMIIKNLKRYFSFEITILDDRQMRRRFRISNFQSTTKIKPFCTSMPIGLSGGWNQIQFNLADFTKRAYGSEFLETLRVQIHANVRLRRIYFTNQLYTEEQLPQDYKLYLPLDRKKTKNEPKDKKKKGPTPIAKKAESVNALPVVPDESPKPVEQKLSVEETMAKMGPVEQKLSVEEMMARKGSTVSAVSSVKEINETHEDNAAEELEPIETVEVEEVNEKVASELISKMTGEEPDHTEFLDDLPESDQENVVIEEIPEADE